MFLQLERLRLLIDAGATLAEAMAIVRRNSTFTTHTPVPAGNEVFTDELAAEYLTRAAAAIGLSMEELAELGKVTDEPGFGLTPLALRTTARANGVSRLHADVARGMWRGLWPNRDTPHVPIESVTNGVHIRTWLEPGIAELAQEAGVELARPAADGLRARDRRSRTPRSGGRTAPTSHAWWIWPTCAARSPASGRGWIPTH